jgi:hypothetical protein
MGNIMTSIVNFLNSTPKQLRNDKLRFKSQLCFVILNLFQDPRFKTNFSKKLLCYSSIQQKNFLSRLIKKLGWILKQVQDDKRTAQDYKYKAEIY